MVEGAEERGRRGQEGRHQNSLFYVDYGMVASLYMRWLQEYFNTLVGLFDRMGLHTNIRKTVIVVFRLCQVAGTQ